MDDNRFPGRAVHGGVKGWQRSLNQGHLIDFSANFNPFPPPFEWSPDPALASEYPDDTYHELKGALARLVGRNEDEFCVGNGSAEVIRTLCHVVVRPGNAVQIRQPTFAEYGLSVRLAGGHLADGDEKAVMQFLCNPNNPDGGLTPRSRVLEIARIAESSGALLAVDEAFIDLADPRETVAAERHDSIFVLRSLTKSFSVPGLRIGYGIGTPELVEKMEMMRPAWSLNSYALDFGLTALRHYDGLEESRRRITEERNRLCSALRNHGITYWPSSTNFVLLDLSRDASAVTAKMLDFGFVIRDCTSFGLPRSIRVAVRNRDENCRLVEALVQCLP